MTNWRSGHPCDKPGLRRAASQSGMALVLVLWVITLLTIIAGGFALGIHREAGTVRYLADAAKARAAAEAGVRFAMLGLMETAEDARWQVNSEPRQVQFADAVLTIEIRDEAGRIDLNNAGPELISGVLLSAGLQDEDRRESLRDNVLDWRDPEPHRRGVAMSDREYRAAGLDYGPRNAPFAAVEELLLIPGLTPDLYRNLLPMVTIHSQRAGIVPAAADRAVLHALPGVDPAIVDDYLAQRSEAREQGLPEPEFPYPVSGGDGPGAYSVTSVARLPSGLEQGVRAVVTPQAVIGREPFGIIHYRLQE